MPNAPVLRAFAAWVSCRTGRQADAWRDLDRLAREGFQGLFSEAMNAPAALCLLAEVTATPGARQHAAQLYDLLLPVSNRCAVWAMALVDYGSVSRYLGILAAMLERWEAAEEHFEAALTANAKMGARPWVARTECDYAAMLLAHSAAGHGERALALLGSALAGARELGMARLAEEATILAGRASATREGHTTPTSALRAASLTPALPRGHDRDALTAREREVLRLLAAGRSNQEIAAALVVSVRTVENHIFNLYGKLGVHGRVEAAAYALRHSLD